MFKLTDILPPMKAKNINVHHEITLTLYVTKREGKDVKLQKNWQPVVWSKNLNDWESQSFEFLKFIELEFGIHRPHTKP